MLGSKRGRLSGLRQGSIRDILRASEGFVVGSLHCRGYSKGLYRLHTGFRFPVLGLEGLLGLHGVEGALRVAGGCSTVRGRKCLVEAAGVPSEHLKV